jgi:hypothetical protein
VGAGDRIAAGGAAGRGAQTIWSDDGIAIRLPEGEGGGDHRAGGARWRRDLLFPSAEEVEDLVVGRLGELGHVRGALPRERGPGLAAAAPPARFADAALAAAPALGRPAGRRQPLRLFPIIVETYRECLADLFDLPALREVLGGVARREIEVREVETVAASPFAGSLLFDYLAAYMYEGDAPLAERRAGALALDRDLLRELLGQEELRDLIDPAALADLELALQALVPERAARTVDALHDLLRRLGDLSLDEVAARIVEPPAAGEWLRAGGLAPRRRVADRRRGALDRDRGRGPVSRRPRSGAAGRSPDGVPGAGEVRSTARGALGRSHGPFHAARAGRRWAVPAARVEEALERLLEAGTILRGEFRPGGTEREWCDPEVLRQLRRRSLARLRARSSRSSRSCWPASCRPGRGSGRSGRRRRGRRAARRRWSGWRRSSISWRACRSRRRCWSATSCRPGSPATSRGCSTSWARSARWPGWGGAASAATTAGSCCTGRAARAARSRGGGREPGGRRGVRPPRSRFASGWRERGASFYRDLASAAGGRPRARSPRRAVGPGLGRRGHQRHVRAAAGAALAAALRRAAATARPAAAGPAGGGRAVVARRRRRAAARRGGRRPAGGGSATHGSTPWPRRCWIATAS